MQRITGSNTSKVGNFSMKEVSGDSAVLISILRNFLCEVNVEFSSIVKFLVFGCV